MSDASGHVTPAQQFIHAASPTRVTDEEATAAARILAGDDWEEARGDQPSPGSLGAGLSCINREMGWRVVQRQAHP
jgi:hypothetical protein